MKKALILTTLFVIAFVLCAAPSSDAGEQVLMGAYAGNVRITPPGENKARICSPGERIRRGAKITTGEESFAEISFGRRKENRVIFKENTEAVFILDGDDKLELVHGELFVLLRDIRDRGNFRVRSSEAVGRGRGAFWRIASLDGVTKVMVFDGTVFVRGIDGGGVFAEDEVDVRQGYQRELRSGHSPGKMMMVPADRMKRMRDRGGSGNLR